MFKHFIFLLICVFSNLNLYSSSLVSYNAIHKEYFPYYVRLESNKIVSNKKIDINSLVFTLKQSYEDSINRAVNRLDNICWGQGNLFVDLSIIQNIAEEEVNVFVAYIESLVFSNQLDSEISEAVCNLLHKNGLVKNDILKSASSEYNSRYEKVKEKLKVLMFNEYRDYVTKQELEKTVNNEFMALIARIKKAKTNKKEQAKPEGSSFWNWLMGNNSNKNDTAGDLSSPTNSQSNCNNFNDKIYKNELEQQIVSIINSVLKENGYNQDSLPARVISDYSDVVQKIIKVSKDRMNRNNYEYLYIIEIKNIARTELQPVFDKIKFKGEKCPICLSYFTSWQKLGVMKCGHVFHKNCIDESLKKFAKKCPLCCEYAENVANTETVPLQ